MTVTVPEGERERVRVERFEIRRDSIEFMRMSMRGRGCREGTFTKLSRGGSLWMSDTDAEKRDHIDVAVEISREDCRRVLIETLAPKVRAPRLLARIMGSKQPSRPLKKIRKVA